MKTHHVPEGDPGDFKTYLVTGPRIEDLEVDRDETPAPVVDLG